MPASYLEKLIWNFFKSRFFGGFPTFIRKESIPLTVFLILLIPLYFTEYFSETILMIYSLILILIGLVLKRRPLSPIITSGISIGGLLLIFASRTITINIPDELLIPIAFIMLLSWFSMNVFMLIYQTAEFFASTAGLLLMYGSDEDRIFLTPLPQLIVVIAIVFSIFAYNKYHDELFLAFIITSIVSFMLMYKLRGKPIRSSLGLFMFFLMYSLISSYYNYGRTINLVYWSFLTLFSLLYIVQSHAKKIIGEKKEVLGFIIFLYGYLILISLIVLWIMQNSGFFRYWILFSALAYLLGLLSSILYIGFSGKLKYYEERSKLELKQLLLEVAVTVGKKTMGGVMDYLSRGISRFFNK